MTRRCLGFDILRVLRGERLACGCLAGIYETYAGRTVTIIDDVAPGCGYGDHREGARFETAPGGLADGVDSARSRWTTASRLVLAAVLAASAAWVTPTADAARSRAVPRQDGRARGARRDEAGTFKTDVPADAVDVAVVRPTDVAAEFVDMRGPAALGSFADRCTFR
jgi:hypothetical protein